MTCCYFFIRGFGGIWKEARAAELFKNSKWRARLRGNQNSDQPFFGRPVFSCGSAASTFCSVARSIWLISATTMRSNSLFLISKPAFRQAFLTWPRTSYSASGMVKLSRTSFGLRAFSLETAGALATALAAGLTAGFTAAFATGLAAAALAAGLTATLAAGFAATLATGLAAALTAGLAATLAAAFTGALATGFTAALATVALAAGLAAA